MGVLENLTGQDNGAQTLGAMANFSRHSTFVLRAYILIMPRGTY